jgi:hypothetical protein
MGGHYAVTDGDTPSFDPRPLKVGDVLWSVFWHHVKYDYDEPTIFRDTVTKVEQVGMQKRGDHVEEEWLVEFEHIGPRSFKINAFNPSYTPYFWTSREAVEASVLEDLKQTVGWVEEEAQQAAAKLEAIRLLVSQPPKFDPEFER